MKTGQEMTFLNMVSKAFWALLTCSLFGSGALAQGQGKVLALEATYYRSHIWLAAPVLGTLGLQWGRWTFGIRYGDPFKLSPSYEVGVFTRWALQRPSLRPVVSPYIATHFTYGYISKSHLIPAANHTYNASLHTGAKLRLWNGIHLIGETGFCVQKIVVPAKRHFVEREVWVRPSVMMGIGYTLGLRPWSGGRQKSDTVPVLELPEARHTLSLHASRAVHFIFPPTIEYRVDYGYALWPRWDVYGGMEFGVSRWFFPTDADRDSVKVLGGRVGGRFFPLGRKGLSYYVDGSMMYGYRLNRYFAYVGPGSKNVQTELGCGLRLGVYKGLGMDVAFFNRWFWVFNTNGVFREGERGIVFGLSYRFGG